jgi:hypothetical protein
MYDEAVGLGRGSSEMLKAGGKTVMSWLLWIFGLRMGEVEGKKD